MRFAKLQGLGNDFVLVDLRAKAPGGPARAAGDAALSLPQAVALCDRHLGIGADGVLTLFDARPGERGARLLIQNSDGSIPEMCGNGARCAALWIATEGCTRPGRGRIELATEAGPRPCEVEAASAFAGEVEVEMGVPQVQPRRTLTAHDRILPATPVSMGNPHLVVFVDGDRAQLAALASTAGRTICEAENANVEVVARLAPQRYAAAVWERGAGLTQACGTGACAVAAAALQAGFADPAAPIDVELPGGTLRIRRDPATGQLRMRGPARLSFRGTVEL